MENKKEVAYSALKEQGEQVPFLYVDGQEKEPAAYETISYASGKPKKKPVLRKQKPTLDTYRKKSDARKKDVIKKKAERVKLAKKLAPLKKTQPSPQPQKKGLSLGAKIGIGVGVAALLGIGIYFIVKKKK